MTKIEKQQEIWLLKIEQSRLELIKKEQLQKDCPHKHKTQKGRVDSGNIMRGRAPSYWHDNVCPECGKHWSTPQ